MPEAAPSVEVPGRGEVGSLRTPPYPVAPPPWAPARRHPRAILPGTPPPRGSRFPLPRGLLPQLLSLGLEYIADFRGLWCGNHIEYFLFLKKRIHD